MIITGIHSKHVEFQNLYVQARKKEGRIYSDAEVLALPSINRKHPHFSEWQIRKNSAEKLGRYILFQGRDLTILEPGCGNGWLAHYLSRIPGTNVTGCDINEEELDQARRVFVNTPNLQFIRGDLSSIETSRGFDLVVFAASIQYFPSLGEIINLAMQKLAIGGEIHILDSPFYRASNLEEAKRRSVLYYERLGYPEMSQYYFHHAMDDLDQFSYKILFEPSGFQQYFLRNKNPFHWVMIKK